jgi:hypothetical protein
LLSRAHAESALSAICLAPSVPQAASAFLFRNFRSPHIRRDREQEAQRMAISFLLPVMQGSGARILPHRARNAGGKINGLKRKVADVLISIAA